MKEYITLDGKVVLAEDIYYGSKTCTVKVNGTVYNGINSSYICDKNGKSIKTGEYYNFKDFIRKEFKCDCCESVSTWNTVNGIKVNKIS